MPSARHLVQRGLELLRSRFARSAGGLALATAAGQALVFVALIVLDKLYTQDDIGVYSAFLSYGAIVQVANLLAYPWSIPNVRETSALLALLALLLALTVLSSALTTLGFAAAGYEHALMLGIFTAGRSLIVIAEQLNIRKQSFAMIMVARVLPPLLFLGAVWAPLLGVSADAALLTQLHAASNLVVGIVYGAWTITPLLRRSEGEPPLTLASLWRSAREERNASLYLMPAQLFQTTAQNLPTILIEQYFSAALAAQYAITVRFGQTPVVLIGGAIGQVYHSRLARTVRAGLPGDWRAFRRLMLLLVGLGAGLGVCTLFVLPLLVRLLLGAEWADAEQMMRILTPMLAVMFVGSTVSTTLIVLGEQRFLFFNQLFFLATTALSFGAAVLLDDLWLGVWAFSLLSAVRHAGLTWRVYIAHRRYMRGGGSPPTTPDSSGSPSQESSAS